MEDILKSVIAGLLVAIIVDLVIVKNRMIRIIIFAALSILGFIAVYYLQATTNQDSPVNTQSATIFKETKPSDSFISGKDGMVLVFVPNGIFTMGSDVNLANEALSHEVYLENFWIDQTEVTNQMYAICVAAGNCVAPSETISNESKFHYGVSGFDNHPVLYVSWNDAFLYCQWAGRRLPTEAEWEKAARGIDGRAYPWGNESPQLDLANYFDSGINGTTEVYQYPFGTSPYGVYGMAGNVYEWVSDFGDQQGFYLVKGGFWLDTPNYLRVSARRELWGLNDDDQGAGFRCAVSASDLIRTTALPNDLSNAAAYPFMCETENQTGSPFYSEAFYDQPGSEWTTQTITASPSGELFLGNFGNQTVNLTLSGLPSHTSMVVKFDLYIIRSWDGNRYGGDFWGISIDDLISFETTFDTWPSDDNEAHRQDFPSEYLGNPDGLFPPNTAATNQNNLGFYDENLDQIIDSTYHFCLNIPHTISSLNITFIASELETQITDDESWGLDNFEIWLP